MQCVVRRSRAHKRYVVLPLFHLRFTQIVKTNSFELKIISHFDDLNILEYFCPLRLLCGSMPNNENVRISI